MRNMLTTLSSPLRLAGAATLLGATLLAGCGNDASDENTLKMGTVAGPETEVMKVAAEIAKEKYDLNVEITEFTDYVSPNAALADGSLDANAYQHQPYMESMVRERGYKFASAGKTFVYPIEPTPRSTQTSANCRTARPSPCRTIRPTKAAP